VTVCTSFSDQKGRENQQTVRLAPSMLVPPSFVLLSLSVLRVLVCTQAVYRGQHGRLQYIPFVVLLLPIIRAGVQDLTR
jgi:hypothetical protein